MAPEAASTMEGPTPESPHPPQQQHQHANDDQTNNNDRVGTTASARFNILSTMVGGGSLSVPMAFQKSGNGLLAPILLLVTACITQFTFELLVQSSRALSPVTASTLHRGHVTYESMTAAAFGKSAFVFSAALVTAMCFFGTVGYAVLLRDMLQPVSDSFFAPFFHQTAGIAGPSKANNLSLWIVVLLVTPLCTLQTLTSLQRFGAASMFSVFILGMVIVYRSGQCLQEQVHEHDGNVGAALMDAFSLLPSNWKDVLDAFPLYISVYVCHYNILTVHNELRAPSVKRVSWWLSSTTWTATIFYMVMGLAGSAYAACTPSGKVSGNVLLDFDEDDPLLLVGRLCLAVTITLAFPMLTIPARDILIRAWAIKKSRSSSEETNEDVVERPVVALETTTTTRTTIEDEEVATARALRKPLLSDEETAATSLNTQQEQSLHDDLLRSSNGSSSFDESDNNNNHQPNNNNTHEAQAQAQDEQGGADDDDDDDDDDTDPVLQASLGTRLAVAMLAFYSAAAVASCVQSIDVVWDLLGSSLSILLCQLIPCGSFLVIMRRQYHVQQGRSAAQKLCMLLAGMIILIFIPLMIISTANAVYDTFLK